MPLTGLRACLAIVVATSVVRATAADPQIEVSKHTTRFIAPLKDDGSVNFAEAVNQHFEGEIQPTENSAIVLYGEILGPAPEGTGLGDEFFKRMGTTVPPEDGQYFLGLGAWLKEQNGGQFAAIQDHYYELDRIASSGPWQKKDAPEVAEWLEGMTEHLARLKKAVQRPRYFMPLVVPVDVEGTEGMLIGVLLPGVQITRSLARALARRANLAMGERRFDDARDDLLTCVRLGRHIGQGATLIERLVGIAVESLAVNGMHKWIELVKPDLDTVRGIRAEFATMLPVPEMAESIAVSERAMFMDIVTALATERTDLAEIAGASGDTAIVKNVQRTAGLVVDWNIVLRRGNEWYDRMTAAMREPNRPARMKASGQIEDDLRKLTVQVQDPATWAKALLPGQTRKIVSGQMSSVLISLLLPAVSAAGTASDRCAQNHDNLLVALSLSAWRRDNGSYPETLDELSPKYLKEIPEDLFIRGPLKYRRTDDGYLLYSVGRNATDDEGRWHDDDPRGDDLSIRMPVPPPEDDE